MNALGLHFDAFRLHLDCLGGSLEALGGHLGTYWLDFRQLEVSKSHIKWSRMVIGSPSENHQKLLVFDGFQGLVTPRLPLESQIGRLGCSSGGIWEAPGGAWKASGGWLAARLAIGGTPGTTGIQIIHQMEARLAYPGGGNSS